MVGVPGGDAQVVVIGVLKHCQRVDARLEHFVYAGVAQAVQLILRFLQKYLRFLHIFLAIFANSFLFLHRQLLNNVNQNSSHMENNQRIGWKSIDKLLHHIFGEDENRAIGYLRSLYLNPTIKPPVLLLWSRDQCTGKTSFLHLLKAMFDDDMRIICDEQLRSRFNGIWAGKRIVGLDECFIDHAGQLKDALTSPTIQIENKGKEPKEIANRSSWVICTNDAESVRKTAPYAEFWSVKTKPIPPEERDPHLHEHIQAELPAFLEFLKNRPSNP